LALIIVNRIIFSLVLIAQVKNMIKFRKLTNTEKHTKHNNMKNRCGKYYQLLNPRYEGTYMWSGWEDNKYETFFVWLDDNYYEVEGEKQMDIDKDIIQYGNKQYHPDFCLIVPHSINTFYETIEVGKTNIKYNSKTHKYRVKVTDRNEPIISDNIDTYNEALDVYCDIKQGILFNKAKALKDKVSEKVYNALMNTDIKAINQKYYESVEGEV